MTKSEGGKFKEYRSIDPVHLFNPKAGMVSQNGIFCGSAL